jgi:hypothetical protein
MGSGVAPSLEAPGRKDQNQNEYRSYRALQRFHIQVVAHEQYSLSFRRKTVRGEKCSIARSYYSAEHVTVRTLVADLAGRLPAGLWRNAILGDTSHLDAFSGYCRRT